MIQIIQYIEEHYDIKVKTFLTLYKKGLSRKDIAETLGVTGWAVRAIAGLLGLRLKSKHRYEDSNNLELRLGKTTNNVASQLIKENKLLSSKIEEVNRQLQGYRDKVTVLNKIIRESNRSQNGYQLLLEQFKTITPIKPKVVFTNVEKATQTIVCLSDLHIGAKVEVEDVGGSNEYNFNIAKQRIYKVINQAVANPTDTLDIILLGDIFDGVIHNSHLLAEMPVMKAVTEFNMFMVEVINKVNGIYKNVTIHIVSGNHERITDEQQHHKKGYDFTYIFSEMLKASVPNVVNYATGGYGIINLPNDKYGLYFHGDIDRTYKSFNQASQLKVLTLGKSLFGVEAELLLSGHTHSYNKSMLPNGGYSITVGTLMGHNSYAYNSGYLPISPTQVILRYNGDGELFSEEVVKLKEI